MTHSFIRMNSTILVMGRAYRYIDVCIQIHLHIYIQIYIDILIYTDAYIYICIQIYRYISTYVLEHMYMYTYSDVYLHMHSITNTYIGRRFSCCLHGIFPSYRQSTPLISRKVARRLELFTLIPK
jgi:hypothetical protein